MAEDMTIKSGGDAGCAKEQGGEVDNVEQCEGFFSSVLSFEKNKRKKGKRKSRDNIKKQREGSQRGGRAMKEEAVVLGRTKQQEIMKQEQNKLSHFDEWGLHL